MNSRLPLITTLVDGYNLMLGSVVSPDAKAKRSLHDSRHYFLRWLESRLEPQQRPGVCIVFDTSRSSHRDQYSTFHGIRIIYSTSHLSADECIQQLIKEHTSPQKLTVVSSDHQIQRAAKARGATSIDSEIWIESLNSPKQRSDLSAMPDESGSEKPDGQIDTQKWLDEFGY
jgi:hypothetical protein